MAGEPALWSAYRTQVQFRGLDEAIWLLAERQHGVVAQWQLLELGFRRHALQRRSQAMRLHPLHRGVYAVGHRVLSQQGRWMAAVLTAGRPAILSHRSAGRLWGILLTSPSRPEVTVPGAARSLRAITRHGHALSDGEITTRDRIPVTTPARTVFDLASVLSPAQLERALARAEHLRLVSPAAIERLIATHGGERGMATLRSVHATGNASLGIDRSKLERLFLSFLDARGLPRPRLNQTLWIGAGPIEADCVWREQRVIAELDGFAHHGDRHSHDADRARDRMLTAYGWRPTRITWTDLHARPDDLEADLRAILGR